METSATDKILAAARKKFAEQGYEGTSVRQIATEAGVNVAMISYYFGGKEALFERIVDERLGLLERNAQRVIDAGMPVKEAVFAVLDAYIDEMLDHPMDFRMIVRELSNPQRGEASRLVYRNVSRLAAMHAAMVRKGQQEGLFRNVDLPLVMISIIGTLFHVLNAHSVVLPMMRGELPDPEASCPACDFTPGDKNRLRKHFRDLLQSYVFATLVETPQPSLQ